MSWVAYAIEVLGTGVVAYLALLLAGLVTALIAAGIARMIRKSRELEIISVLVLVAFLAPALYGAAQPWPTIQGFVPYAGLVAIAVLFGDLRHVSQWLALGVGMLMLAGGFLVALPGQVPPHLDFGVTLGFSGMLVMLFGPGMVDELLRSRARGGERCWHLSRWSSYELFMLLLALVISVTFVTMTTGQNQPLLWAVAALPISAVVIGAILKDRLWHPSKWWRPRSAYQAGLLAVAISVIIVGVSGQSNVGRFVGAALFLAGVVTTLYGSLRYPAQWLAAAAGAAAMAGVAFFPLDRGGGSLFLVGVLTILFAPRLIGSHLEAGRRAREQMRAP